MALSFGPSDGRGARDWFFHIPRTGGNYTIYIITKCTRQEGKQIYVKHRGHMHAGPAKVSPELIRRCFTAVRPPLDWYRSFYRFRIAKHYVGKNMEPGHPLDKYIWTGQHQNGGRIYPFNEFVGSVVAAYPHGYLRELYRRFMPYVDEVLCTDNLTRELPAMLERWGYQVPQVLKKPRNKTKDRDGNWAPPRKFSNWVKRGHPVDELPVDIEPSTLTAMEAAEHKIIKDLRDRRIL